MKNRKLKVLVVKEKKGYSASAQQGTHWIATEGDTFEELRKNILEAMILSQDLKGSSLTGENITYEYDLESFFDFYRVINAKALSERIGMNQSLLAQYIRGIKKPSRKQMERILDGVHQIGIELTEVNLLY